MERRFSEMELELHFLLAIGGYEMAVDDLLGGYFSFRSYAFAGVLSSSERRQPGTPTVNRKPLHKTCRHRVMVTACSL
jgi:hypothetical protein